MVGPFRPPPAAAAAAPAAPALKNWPGQAPPLVAPLLPAAAHGCDWSVGLDRAPAPPLPLFPTPPLDAPLDICERGRLWPRGGSGEPVTLTGIFNLQT